MKDSRREIPVVTETTENELSQVQLDIYVDEREKFIDWLQHDAEVKGGNSPGYAFSTVRRTAYDTDRWHRWVWDLEDNFTTRLTTDHGDEYLHHVRHQELSATAKAARLKSLKRYFRWQETEWEPSITFSGDNSQHAPKDYFTREERAELRNGSLDMQDIPSPNKTWGDDEEAWNELLAERHGKPASEITDDDWRAANSYKMPSLVYVSLDGGLRPIEVARARVGWCDTVNNRLLIPADQSSKNRNNWSVALKSDTTKLLDRWLDERELYDKYDGTDRLWLTRHDNPFSSRSLNYWLDKLIEKAGIETRSRDLTWYAMRHSTATYMADARGLKAAKDQLRHNRIETTSRYDQTPDENRRDALEDMEP